MRLSRVLWTGLLKSNKGSVFCELFVKKKDAFAVLPTGFGKSAIYQLIPKVLSHMGRSADDIKTTVAVVSPLDSGLYVDGEGPIYERCLLGVYYSQTPKRHKDCVTSSFEGVSGNVRMVFATTSLSMGIDFPHVKLYVIHYGPSNNLTSHLQEAGRGGRNGNQAFHITLYHGRLITCEGDIKTAVKHSLKSCCRVEFLRSFDETVSALEPLHDCCSVCHQSCNCLGDSCGKVVPEFDFVPESVEDVKKSRDVSENDKECVKEALKEVQRSLSCQTQVRMFDDSGVISHGFPDKLIDKIVSNEGLLP